mgnify:FL=1|tara:strand:+ start:881 stop:1135 length:255 start_codon:yes stop_codon:yes gene_type:complete
MDIIYNHDGIRIDVENVEEKVKRLEIMLASTVEECILLKKQIKYIRKERDAYKLYVPTELLSMGSNLAFKGCDHITSVTIPKLK